MGCGFIREPLAMIFGGHAKRRRRSRRGQWGRPTHAEGRGVDGRCTGAEPLPAVPARACAQSERSRTGGRRTEPCTRSSPRSGNDTLPALIGRGSPSPGSPAPSPESPGEGRRSMTRAAVHSTTSGCASVSRANVATRPSTPPCSRFPIRLAEPELLPTGRPRGDRNPVALPGAVDRLAQPGLVLARRPSMVRRHRRGLLVALHRRRRRPHRRARRQRPEGAELVELDRQLEIED